MTFMRNLRKNKFVVLAICVIAVSLIYTGVQSAIDSYAFNKNEDIVSNEENSDEINLDLEGGSDNLGSSGSKGNSGTEGNSENEGNLGNEGANDANNDNNGKTNSGEATSSNQTDDASEDYSSAESNNNKIYVYITGEVNAPGVVILNEGSRIVDAINAAGGTTAEANVSKVNLVYILEDGMKVNIPNDNDLKNNPDFEYITLNSGDGGQDDYYRETSSANVDGSNSSGSNSSAGSGIESDYYGNEKQYSVVNINTATQTELETLPGIGPSLALNIINYRKENGRFSSIEEIKNVRGIGDARFENLKAYITV